MANSRPCRAVRLGRGYRSLIAGYIASGVLLDEGMVDFDARLSRDHPTVEVRVADVCLYAEDAVLIAALVRGPVETAAKEWRQGIPPRLVKVSSSRKRTLAVSIISRPGRTVETGPHLTGVLRAACSSLVRARR